MTQQLRALPPLTEDPGPVLGTNLATDNCLMPAPGDPVASSGLHRHLTCGTHMYMRGKHSYT